MDVLDRTVRHRQPMLKIKICPCLGPAVDSLLHTISVVGMNSLEYQLKRWLNRAIVLKDLVGFPRPVDFSARYAEAACVADALPLSQESFASLQIRIEVGVLQRN